MMTIKNVLILFQLFEFENEIKFYLCFSHKNVDNAFNILK
jgi:hypothetical protein